MKFLILLAIIGFVAAAPVSKDDLLKRAADLEARLAAAEEKVRTSNPVEAKIFEAELRTLKTLPKDLEGASEAAVVARLEMSLAVSERVAEATLKRIESAFVAAPIKEELLKRATDLEARLTAAEAKVRTSIPVEGRILEAELRNLKTLAKELEAATEAAVVARIETRLVSAERTAEATLRRIEGNSGTSTTAASFGSSTLLQKSTTQLITSRISTTSPLIKTTPEKISNTCETEFIKKLSQTVKKLNEKIDVLSQQNKEDEAIQLSNQVHQVLLWEKQIENLFIQVNKIVEQVDIIERGL